MAKKLEQALMLATALILACLYYVYTTHGQQMPATVVEQTPTGNFVGNKIPIPHRE